MTMIHYSPAEFSKGTTARTKQKSIKSLEQPKTPSQMDNTGVKSDLITADKTAPTDAEISLTNKKPCL